MNRKSRARKAASQPVIVPEEITFRLDNDVRTLVQSALGLDPAWSIEAVCNQCIRNSLNSLNSMILVTLLNASPKGIKK